ncbi:MAG: hypothetical protein RIR26_1104 [Pseudomonadota bacterium]
MKQNKKATALITLGALGVFSGCNTEPPLPKAARGYYKKETLGELPIAPNSNKAPDVISLVQPAGETPEYRTKVATSIRVGDTMNCQLKAGSIVNAIADADTQFLVQAEKSSLSEPCANSGDATYVEGYVNKSDLEFVSMPSSSGQAVNQGIESTAQPAPTATAPVSGGTETSTSYNGCTSVKFGSRVEGVDKETKQLIAKKAKKGRIPGKLWREGGEEFFLQINGSAAFWKVQAFDKSKNRTMTAKSISSASLQKVGNNEVILPFNNFVENPNQWKGVDIEIVVTPQSSQGVEGTQKCVQEVRLASPLVLDFSGRKMISTLALSKSNVEFDLNADGYAEQVGWVDGRTAAFLVLDLNGNGRVDNGRELFGEATRLVQDNKSAEEGFSALAQYDVNKDQKIDEKDPVFSKLRLWFDANGNGRTDANELVPLSQKNVSFISIENKAVPTAQALQHLKGIPNDVRTQAVFGAAGCPAGGCKIYDIYFGSVSSSLVSQK